MMKKLSLKRKLPQGKHEIKIHNCQTHATTDYGVSKPKSGKSESETVEVTEVEQREPGHADNELSRIAQKKSVFLGTDDPSLNRLRQMILNLAPKERNIPELPPVYTDYQNGDGSGSTEWVQGRQPSSSSKVQEFVELSPFPKVCRHLIHSKEISGASSKRDTFNLSNKLFQLSDPPHITSGQCEKSVNTVTKCENNVNTVTKCENNVNTVTKCEKRVNGVTMEKHTNNIHLSTYRENNSNLLRDRNSNLYVLQSQNASIICSNTCNSNAHHSNSNAHPIITSKREFVSIAGRHQDNVKTQKASDHSVSGDCIQPETTSNSVQIKCADTVEDKTSFRDQSIDDTSLDAVTLKNCPLCQTQFSDRQNQMDVDSHIATCLAASDDSTTW